MSKQNLLSAEISRARALVAGGAGTGDVLFSLRQWRVQAPLRGTRRVSDRVFVWSESLCRTLADMIATGASASQLLREVQPMVRKEERQWVRRQTIERQFGFQGAIVMVLPWAVAGLSARIDFNWITGLGAVLQLIGLVLFYLMLKRAMRDKDPERRWIFDFLLGTWMLVLGGQGLQAALRASVRVDSLGGRYHQEWERWLSALGATGVQGAREFIWALDMRASTELSAFLLPLLQSGAPAAGALSELLTQVEDDRQAELDESLGALPTRISLIFCALFTPALFLILLGALWPDMNRLMM